MKGLSLRKFSFGQRLRIDGRTLLVYGCYDLGLLACLLALFELALYEVYNLG